MNINQPIFFTDMELLKAYIAKCDSLEIPIRFLFVESSRYAEEIWPYEIPERTFLGYEVAEIPLDPWDTSGPDETRAIRVLQKGPERKRSFQNRRRVAGFSERLSKGA